MGSGVKKWLRGSLAGLSVALAAVIFFIGAASFNYFTQSRDFVKWLSPDETANYVFAKLYADTGRLEFFEKYNLLAGDIIRPRSFKGELGVIKPMSFLGLPLIYGSLARLGGDWLLPFLTPLLAGLGLIFFYLLVKEIFGVKVAVISAWLAAFFPAYIYYSARSMFHNVLFTVLFIISLYLAVLMAKDQIKIRPRFWAALAGMALGAAISVRASELIWLIPLWLIIWLFNLKRVGWLNWFIFIAFALLSLTPAMYYNQILYGSIWRGGYSEMNQSIINLAGAGGAIIQGGLNKASILKDNLTVIKKNFFYFGLQPVKSLKMLYYYFALMFYWLFWPAMAGFIFWLWQIKKWQKRHWVYLAAYAVASAILLFYYGSWDFHDNPDPKSFTIGNSYTRYWFLVYFGALPFTAMFLLKITSWLRNKYLVFASRVVLLAVAAYLSLNLVLAGSDEGLIKTANNQLAAKAEFNRLLNLTEPRSVIITRYHDKLLFPERKVIVGLFENDEMIKQYSVLAGYLPLYYYNFTLPDKDLNFLNQTILPTHHLKIAPVEKITDKFTLYKLSLKQ